jgi:hypothetical protein
MVSVQPLPWFSSLYWILDTGYRILDVETASIGHLFPSIGLFIQDTKNWIMGFILDVIEIPLLFLFLMLVFE